MKFRKLLILAMLSSLPLRSNAEVKMCIWVIKSASYEANKAQLVKALSGNKLSIANPIVDLSSGIDVLISSFYRRSDVQKRIEESAQESRRDGLSYKAGPFEIGINSDKSLHISLRADNPRASEFYQSILEAHTRGELIPLMQKNGVYRIELHLGFDPSPFRTGPPGVFRPISLELIPDKDGNLIVGTYNPNMRPESSQMILKLGAAKTQTIETISEQLTRFFGSATNYFTSKSVNHTAKEKIRKVLGFDLSDVVRSTMSNTMAVDVLNILGFQFNPMAAKEDYWEKVSTYRNGNLDLIGALKALGEHKLVYVSKGFVVSALYRANDLPNYLDGVVGGGVAELGDRRQTPDISRTAMYIDLVAAVNQFLSNGLK